MNANPRNLDFHLQTPVLGAYVSSQRITQEQILEGDPNQVYKKKNHPSIITGALPVVGLALEWG